MELLSGLSAYYPGWDANLQAWYDFSDITTLYQDNLLTTPVAADGDVIGGVTDKSTNARNLLQSSAGSKPLYKTNIVNGRACALFDGSNDRVTNAAPTFGAQPRIVCVAFKSTAVSGSDVVFDSGSGGNVHKFTVIHGTGYRMQANTTLTGGTPDNNWHAAVCYFNTTSSAFYLDDESALFTGDVGTHNMTGLNIGANLIGSDPLAGYVGELFILNAALDNHYLDRLLKYLKSKWK